MAARNPRGAFRAAIPHGTYKCNKSLPNWSLLGSGMVAGLAALICVTGGEKRMAAIATILAMEPEMVIMDEPSTALDPCNRRTVINTINRLPQTKLIVSHDLDMILDTCQRVILLSHGRIAADGNVDTILRDKNLLETNRMELPFCLQRR